MKPIFPADQYVQMNFQMDVPLVERNHRRNVKRQAELLWDEMQRTKKKLLATPENS